MTTTTNTALKNVLLIGAGGNVGATVLDAFTSDPHFTVSILTRQSSKSVFPSNLTVHRVSDDYPESELVSAFQGQDAIVVTISRLSAHKQRDFIDAAVKAGVKRFVPSEFGGDTRDEKALAILPQLYGKKNEVVDYLKGKEKDGLTWSAVVTGPIFELGITSGFMGFDVKNQKVSLFNGGGDPWSTTNLSTIGLAIKNALLVPNETANKYLYIESLTVSQSEVVVSLEKATGKTWERELVDAEEMRRTGLEKMSKGDHSGVVSLIRYVNCVRGHGGNYAESRGTANEVLGLPKATLDEEVRKLVSKGL